MSVPGAQAAITKVVTAWDGITAQPHRFGGLEYMLGTREIGHIHGDHLVDIPFPKKCAMRSCRPDAPSPITFCRRQAG
jgi:hypothetical protein